MLNKFSVDFNLLFKNLIFNQYPDFSKLLENIG